MDKLVKCSPCFVDFDVLSCLDIIYLQAYLLYVHTRKLKFVGSKLFAWKIIFLLNISCRQSKKKFIPNANY